MFAYSFATVSVSMVSMMTLVMFTVIFLLFPDNAALSPNPGGSALMSMPATEDTEGAVESEAENTPVHSTFEPSKEWSTILPGQGVPRGIHVRLNLQTGLNEGKLLEEEDEVDQSDRLDFTDDEKLKSQVFTKTELKEAVKNFRADMDDVKDPEVVAEAKKKKWRSYQELKDELELQNTGIKTDLEILREKLNLIHDATTSDDDKKVVLEDLEYLLHQYDNAVNFVDMGGLDVVATTLNHSDVEFRNLASLMMISAAQSNIKVQAAILESGLLSLLMRTFSLENDMRARKRHFSAISAVLRQYPAAQKKFMEFGGPEIIQNIFTNSDVDLELKIRAVTFINDLVSEVHELETDVITGQSEFDKAQQKLDMARREQYQQVGLMDTVIQRGWCEQIEKVLQVTYPNLDSTEKTLHTLELIMQPCARNFVNLKDHLINLRGEFTRQSADVKLQSGDNGGGEFDAEWVSELLHLTDTVLNQYYSSLKQEL